MIASRVDAASSTLKKGRWGLGSVQLIEKRPLFGAFVEFVLDDATEELAGPVIDAAYDEGLRLSGIFNVFDEHSELSRLNAQRSLRVSPELLEVLAPALAMAERTQGRYDVTLGALFAQRKRGEPESRPDCSYADVLIDGDRVTLAHPDVVLDLGSIAKGYIVDRIVERLESEGVASGLVDGRGDIRVFGDHEEILGIAHPREEGATIGKVRLRDGSVATSGDYRQYHGSYDSSHIVNAQDAVSITVLAPTLMAADLYATALFVCEPSVRERIIAEDRIVAYVVDRELAVTHCNGFAEALVR